MTMRYKRQRNVKLVVATVVGTLAFIASTVGFMASASAVPAEEAPANVEKEVTDLSKYVFLHQTRNVSVLYAALPAAVPCDTDANGKHGRTAGSRSESI